MSTALCITQFRFLERFSGLTGREPHLFEDCDYSSLFESISDAATAKKASLDLQYYVARPDLNSDLKNNPISHFDAEGFLLKCNSHLIQTRKLLLKTLKSTKKEDEDMGQIRQVLGEVLHVVEDFYSHTNWVELGKTGINPRVGVFEDLGIAINPPNSPACRQCSKDEMTQAEQNEVDDMKTSLLSLTLVELAGFSFDNIYVCRDNVIARGLTSGYYGTEADKAPKPSGKCSHGGGNDFSADNTTAKGGMNKDSDSVVFSPHYYLHHHAANLSVLATIRYLEDLRISLDDDALFGRIIGVSKLSAVGFVIDTTESMHAVLQTVQTYITTVINNADAASVFYVTTFNDPLRGYVHKFFDKAEAKHYVQSLKTGQRVDSKKTAYDSILNMANALPTDSTVFVFTDAESGNQHLLPIIQQVAQQKHIKISNLMIENELSKVPVVHPKARGRRQAQKQDMSGFEQLNRATGGSFLTLKDGHEFENMSMVHHGNDLETMFYVENVRVDCQSGGLDWTIPVDETMSSFQVLLTTAPDTDASLSDLTASFTDSADRDRELQLDDTNLLVDTSTNRLYRFNVSGSPGVRHFHLDGACPSAGPFTVNIQTESYLLSNVMFHDSDGDRVLGQPIIGERYTVYISCSDCAAVNSIEYRECGNDSVLQRGEDIDRLKNKDWFYAKAMQTPDVALLCVQFSGSTKKGHGFTRVYGERFVPTLFVISGNLSSRAYPGQVRASKQGTAVLDYRIDNLSDAAQTFDVIASSKRGNGLSPAQDHVEVESKGFYRGQIEVEINTNDAIDTITLTAIPTTGKSESAVTRSFDLTIVDEADDEEAEPNTDTTAAAALSCHMVSSTAADCPSQKTACGGQNYSVEFRITDHGAGLARVDTGDINGTWVLPDVPEDSSLSTREMSGVLSCCDDAKVEVVDKQALRTACQIQIKSAAAPTALNILIVFVCVFQSLLRF